MPVAVPLVHEAIQEDSEIMEQSLLPLVDEEPGRRVKRTEDYQSLFDV
jgi:hypothetical protein